MIYLLERVFGIGGGVRNQKGCLELLEGVFGIGGVVWIWRGCLELEGVFKKYKPHPLKIKSGAWKICPSEVFQYEWCY